MSNDVDVWLKVAAVGLLILAVGGPAAMLVGGIEMATPVILAGAAIEITALLVVIVSCVFERR